MNLSAWSALLVVTVIAAAGCGSTSGPSEAHLAAQDKRVIAAGKAGAAQARIDAVAHQLKMRRMRARLAKLHARRVRLRRAHRPTVFRSAGASTGGIDICAPIRGGTRASRSARRALRRQMLSDLNLRC
jgi:hypothetical protein